MLSEKVNPVGQDKQIQALQSYLYQVLLNKWKLTNENFLGYGRCYREKVDVGYVPKVFVSDAIKDNTTYEAIEFDDTNTAGLFFFDVGDIVTYDSGSTKAKVDLIFIVNLPKIKLYESIIHRSDEEVRRDVEIECSKLKFGFTMIGFITGFLNVFQRFDGLLKNDQLNYRDTHPLHVFKIKFDLLYSIKDC